MESSIAESLWRQPACELLPTNFTNRRRRIGIQREEGLAGCGGDQEVFGRLRRSGQPMHGKPGRSAKTLLFLS